jgi:hypothetical protein
LTKWVKSDSVTSFVSVLFRCEEEDVPLKKQLQYLIISLILATYACKPPKKSPDASSNGGTSGMPAAAAGMSSSAGMGGTSGTGGSGGTAGEPTMPTPDGSGVLHLDASGTEFVIDANGDFFLLDYGANNLITKRAPDGTELLRIPMPPTTEPLTSSKYFFYHIATDANGNVAAIGQIVGAFVGETVREDKNPRSDLAVVRFDTSGELLWAHQYSAQPQEGGIANGILPYDLAMDPEGNTYIVGNAAGPLDGEVMVLEDNEMFYTLYGGMFVMKISPDGERLWASAPTIASADFARIDVNADGEAYVVCSSFDVSDPLNSVPKLTVIKFAKDGAPAGTVMLNTQAKYLKATSLITDGPSIVLSDDGESVYIGGHMNADFNDDELPALPAEAGTTQHIALFVAKFDEDLEYQWGRTVRSNRDPSSCENPDDCFAHTTVVDMITSPDGSAVYTVGYARAEHVTPKAGDSVLFFTKHTADGDLEWTRRHSSISPLVDPLVDTVFSMERDPDGVPVIMGSTWGSFGNEPYDVTSFGDLFFGWVEPDSGDLYY